MLQTLRKQYYAYRADDRQLRDYLRGPTLDFNADYREQEFLALDLEMTSLDAAIGEVVSIGFVPIVKGVIDISQGFASLVRSDNSVGESAAIHGICDRHLSGGMAMADVMPVLFKALQGRVLVLHHAALDMAFLNRYCRHIYNSPFLARVVDTMALELKRLRMQQSTILPGQVRLSQCRERYGLPEYPAHHAYTDALATAELFLAQAAARAGARRLRLKELLAY